MINASPASTICFSNRSQHITVVTSGTRSKLQTHSVHPVSRSSLCKGSDLCTPCWASIANSSVLSNLPTNTPDFHLKFQMLPSTERPLNMQVSLIGTISIVKLLPGVCPDASSCIRLTTQVTCPTNQPINTRFAPVSGVRIVRSNSDCWQSSFDGLVRALSFSKACSRHL